MTAVIARTKTESPKIESAGVDAGLKILVEVEGSPGNPAEAAGNGHARLIRVGSARLRFDLSIIRTPAKLAAAKS